MDFQLCLEPDDSNFKCQFRDPTAITKSNACCCASVIVLLFRSNYSPFVLISHFSAHFLVSVLRMERFFLLFLFCQGCHPFSCATVFLQCLFECLQISSDINNHSERVIFSVWYNATMWRMPFVSLIVRASKFHVWVLLFFSLPWFGWKRLLLFEVPIFHFQSWNLMSFFCHETPIKEAF